jgi:hypothetical protein
LDWEIEEIPATTPAGYKYAFVPPSWVKEKDIDNEKQHDLFDDVHAKV